MGKRVSWQIFLDTFFHLPTLITIAMFTVVLVVRLYQVNLDVGDGFLRLSTTAGQVMLYWQNGCCRLDW
ncbi:MAG: hypothetical protein D6784_05540 [Chloroflexi bacterium]|nr:MAG: hypothetical protein D6784_05540 [Chloroflexota bacterium]